MSAPKREGAGRAASHPMVKSRSVCVPARRTWKRLGGHSRFLAGGVGTMRNLTVLHVSLSFQCFIISACVILKLDTHFFLKKVYLAALGFRYSTQDLR